MTRAWIAEDVESILSGVKSGSWIDTTLGAVSAGLDALAFISDPIGSLLQYGVAWIIEHIKPLSEALDWLAGDPGTAADAYRTWTGQQRDAVAALARAAETMAAITEGAGVLVAGVRMMVRDAIAVLVSRLITYATEEVFSLGLATPLVVEQCKHPVRVMGRPDREVVARPGEQPRASARPGRQTGRGDRGDQEATHPPPA